MIQHKKCKLCKRLLTYDLFGSLKKSPDGLRSACKECTNHISKASYARRSKPDYMKAPSYEPLQMHNTKVLFEGPYKDLPIEGPISIELHAKHASTDTLYKVVISRDDDWLYALYEAQSNDYIEKLYINKGHSHAYVFDILISALQRLEIRLESMEARG